MLSRRSRVRMLRRGTTCLRPGTMRSMVCGGERMPPTGQPLQWTGSILQSAHLFRGPSFLASIFMPA
jgi:hypothetical protein